MPALRIRILLSLVAVIWIMCVASTHGAEAIINVRNFGALADGTTDDTAAIQKAIDSADPSGGTVLFPPGTYQVTSVGLKAGVRYLGYGATIRRPPQQGKWVRTFDAAKVGYQHSSDSDSATIHIEGLEFDGNRQQQNSYEKYELEQAHLIFLSADPAKAGRLRVRVSNCTFRDCVADAISIYTNVEAQITNCTAVDCFRGGMVLTGGNSRVQLSQFIARGKTHPTGIDVEVDGAGYQNSTSVELLMDNVSLPDGDFDVGVQSDSVVIGSRVVAAAPFHLYGGGTARLVLSDSDFQLGDFEGGNRIALPGDLTFRNCRFTVQGKPGVAAIPPTADPAGKAANTNAPREWAAARIFWNISSTSAKQQRVRFQDCLFRAVGLSPGAISYGIFTYADPLQAENHLEVTGGEITPDFAQGIHIHQGGHASIRNMRIAAQLPLSLGSSTGYSLDVLIDGVDVSTPATDTETLDKTPSQGYAHINTSGAANRITHRNVTLDAGRNKLTTDYGLVGNSYFGQRTIEATAEPTAETHGIVGDILHVRSAESLLLSTWRCTKTGCGQNSEWKRIVDE